MIVLFINLGIKAPEQMVDDGVMTIRCVVQGPVLIEKIVDGATGFAPMSPPHQYCRLIIENGLAGKFGGRLVWMQIAQHKIHVAFTEQGLGQRHQALIQPNLMDGMRFLNSSMVSGRMVNMIQGVMATQSRPSLRPRN